MPRARILNPVEVDDGTAYQVEAWDLDDTRFDGPDGRDWTHFVLVDKSEAEFDWRVDADAQYSDDDDRPAADAANCLDLPSWADVSTVDEGGPGTGYEQTIIVLYKGWNLKDLAEWFARLEGR